MDVRNASSLKVGNWLVEPALNRLSRDGVEVLLESKVMDALLYLAGRAGQVVTQDDLITRVWSGRPVGDNSVYQCITRLRKALGDDPHAPAYLATVPKKGYRLIAAVTPVSLAALQPPDEPATPSPGLVSRRWPGAALLLVVAVVTLIALAREAGGERVNPATATPAIAVLPFSEPGDRPAYGLSGSSLAKVIADGLAQAPNVRVIDQGSVARFTGRRPDARAIARQLNVDYVLMGELRRQDQLTMLDARLVDSAGAEFWRGSFSYRQDELLPLVGRITRQIADGLQVTIDPALTTLCGGTENIEACRLALLAQEHMRSQGPKYKTKAIDLLHQAIEQDPGYAFAHANLGITYLLPSDEIPWPEAKRRADIAIQRALELSPALAEAIAAEGFAQMVDPRGPCPPECSNPAGYQAAESSLRKALQRKPGLVQARNWLADSLYGQGRVREAFEQRQTALLHDPLNPETTYAIAWNKAMQGDAAGARQQIREFLQHPHAPPFMYGALAGIEESYGNLDETLRLRDRMLTEAPSSYANYVRAWIAWDYTNLGRFDDARKVLADSEATPLADEIYPAAHQHLLIAQARWPELEAYTTALIKQANQAYAKPAPWPPWLLRQLGKSNAVLGHHDQARAYLEPLYGDADGQIDHSRLIGELDSMQFLGYSLRKLGKTHEADAILEKSLGLILDRKAQGYTGYPDLSFAEARTYAMQGNRALAVATLRQAVAQGWRRYWSMHADPRWDGLRSDPEFQEILIEVRRDVEKMAKQTPSYAGREP